MNKKYIDMTGKKYGRLTVLDITDNGIDRVDNSKGYTSDNCVPCCWACNNAKKNNSSSEFLAWVDGVYTFQHIG